VSDTGQSSGVDPFRDPVTGRYTFRNKKGQFQREPKPYEQLNIWEYAGIKPPESPWHTFESSRCKAALYDPSENVLIMAWTNGRTAWYYNDVSAEDYSNLISASSAGKYVNDVLNSKPHGRVQQTHIVKYLSGNSSYLGI